MLPGWVLSLLAGSLLLPVLVASVDAFARARRRQRRRAAVAALARRPGSRRSSPRSRSRSSWRSSAPRPSPPPAPVPPDVLPLDGPALGVLGGVARGDGARVLARHAGSRRGRTRAREAARPRRRRGARARDRRGLAPASGSSTPTRGCSSCPPRTCGCCSRSPGRCRRAGCALVLIAVGAAAGAARGDLLHVRALGRPAVRPLVPADARDGPERRDPHVADRLRDARAACATVETALRWPDVQV